MKDSSRLLRWYDRIYRKLPWRDTRDPYAIWVSEIMLQQTRVETVLPYYSSFLEVYPTVQDLATAPVEDVLARWSGLGYYRRARQLHAAASEVVKRGGIPKSSQELMELPGIGAYTSAAIASIAFGEVTPVLDGNVERLLTRRLALLEDPKRPKIRRRLLAVAADLLDHERPGDSNQALMELGATVCRRQNPLCSECPLVVGCRGFESGNPERFPLPKKRRQFEQVDLAVVVVRERGRLLFFKRPEHYELMPGLWELPNCKKGGTKKMESALGAAYGGRWTLGPLKQQVQHAITFRRLTLHVCEGTISTGNTVAQAVEAAWILPEDFSKYAMSSMVAKVLGS